MRHYESNRSSGKSNRSRRRLLGAAVGTISDTFSLPGDLAADFGAVATGPLGESATTSFSSAFAAAGPPPTIVSDKHDYGPGETVTLTGANWEPNESVHIHVDDSDGQLWSYDADVAANATGGLSHQFQLPNSFIANYSVTATGSSGSTQTT